MIIKNNYSKSWRDHKNAPVTVCELIAQNYPFLIFIIFAMTATLWPWN